MTDTSTTAGTIQDMIEEVWWARRPQRRGIKDGSVTSQLMKSLTSMGVVFSAPQAVS